jgi:hypothetical protein
MRKLLGLFLCVASCLPYAKLSPPAPTAPFEERRVAYEDLRIKTGTVMVSIDKQSQQEVDRYFMHITLGDGTLLVYPQDLLQVVKPESTTARFAKESVRLYKRTRRSLLGMPGGALLGLAGGALIEARVSEQDTFFPSNPDPVFLLGGAFVGLFVAMIPTVIVAAVSSKRGQTARLKAFSHYDGDLRAFLNLCATDDFLYDCDQPHSQPTS